MMNNWEIFSGTDDQWEEKVSRYDNLSYLLNISWARHLEFMGWEISRWYRINSNGNVELLQGFLKRYPFSIGILWFPEWINGDQIADNNFAEKIRYYLGLKNLYIRFRSSQYFDDLKYMKLLEAGWQRPKHSLDTDLTMVMNLEYSVDYIEQNLTKNWKRNLKRSKRENIQILRIYDSEAVINLYEEMNDYKKIKNTYNRDEIKSIMDTHNKKIIILGAVMGDTKIIAIRGAIIKKKNAWDIFAATSILARKKYISYGLFWTLILQCKKEGCVHYDLNGIDPIKSAGVYNFKKGTGASIKHKLGEFEWSNRKYLKFFINQYLINTRV